MTALRPIRLKPGRAYYVYERSPDYVFQVFRDAVRRNRAGLIISRTNPMILREDRKLRRATILWLTDADGDDRVSVNDSVRLCNQVRSFVKAAENAVVAIEGV